MFQVKNALLWEIKRFYKDEFEIGMKALDMIEEKTKIRFPDDEAGFIYYRFITHLKFFSQRLFQHNTYNGDLDDDLLEVIRCKYSEAFECILKIKTFIKKK